MKGRVAYTMVSLLLAWIVALCAVVEHHHHAADGSVCLCLHMDCHGHSDEAHHHGCSHDHSGEGECLGCALHIDDFCCKDNLRVKALLSDVLWACFVVQELKIEEVNSSSLCDYQVFDAPKQKLPEKVVYGLRAPPFNDVFKV